MNANKFWQVQSMKMQPTLFMQFPQMRFASKIMGGSTSNKKDSAGRRLGIKKWGHNEEIFRGDILAKQRGHKWHPGMHVKSGNDHTLHSTVEVSFFSI